MMDNMNFFGKKICGNLFMIDNSIKLEFKHISMKGWFHYHKSSGSLHGSVANMLDYDIVVSKFKLLDSL